jgi:hypothetical protein
MKIQICILLFTTSLFAANYELSGSYPNYATRAPVNFKIRWNEEKEKINGTYTDNINPIFTTLNRATGDNSRLI